MGTVYHWFVLLWLASPTVICFDENIPLRPATTPLRMIELSPENPGVSVPRVPSIFQAGEGRRDVGKTLVVNGYEVHTSEFGYMVSIQVVFTEYKRFHICAGVLIAPNKVLTAAHCLDFWGYYPHYAAVGFQRLSEQGEGFIKVKSTNVHPGYDETRLGFPNDIAVLTLEEDAVLSDNVKLANMSTDVDPVPDNYFLTCTVPGWGMSEDDDYPDAMRYIFLYHLSNDKCKRFFRYFGNNIIRHRQTCGWRWPMSACFGDSGGPLMCDGHVTGITSWAIGCEGCFPQVFTRVSLYADWIERQM